MYMYGTNVAIIWANKMECRPGVTIWSIFQNPVTYILLI